MWKMRNEIYSSGVGAHHINIIDDDDNSDRLADAAAMIFFLRKDLIFYRRTVLLVISVTVQFGTVDFRLVKSATRRFFEDATSDDDGDDGVKVKKNEIIARKQLTLFPTSSSTLLC